MKLQFEGRKMKDEKYPTDEEQKKKNADEMVA
jgi:hypothetical protein